MRDTQSKINDWLNDIPTGYAGGTTATTGLSCSGTGGQPKFSTGSSPATPDTGDCIFLGKVLQFTDSSDPRVVDQDRRIFAYSVFGLRNFTLPDGSQRPVANLVEAKPIAAVGIPSYSGAGDLTETYTIPGDTRVKKILKSSGQVWDTSHLGGFFLSFNPLQVTASGSAGLTAYQYPYLGDLFPGDYSHDYNYVDDCISMVTTSYYCTSTRETAPGQWPPPLTDWEICFDNDSNGDTAVLTISSVNGLGVSTKLEFESC